VAETGAEDEKEEDISRGQRKGRWREETWDGRARGGAGTERRVDGCIDGRRKWKRGVW
jgi:hypothetical protein